MSHTHGIRRDRGTIGPFVAGGVTATAAILLSGVLGIGLFGNPFSTATVDHSPPPVLTELRDLAEYHAAEARFEVVIDEEHDVRLVPQFLAGERVQYIAVGSVDAVVDFTGLTDAAIEVDDETSSVVVTVPAPTMAAPMIDHELSHVMNRDRGLVDRVGGVLEDSPTSEQELLLTAETKMADAAAATDLLATAESNTESMLRGLLGALGFESVEVRFEQPTA